MLSPLRVCLFVCLGRETAELLIKVEADQSEAEAVQQVVAKDVTEANKVAAEVQVGTAPEPQPTAGKV